MNQVPRDNILEYPPDTFQCILKCYGLNNAEILNDSIKSLQDWINKQDHFVRKEFERKHLEWTLMTSKGSIERAKERLDKYCTGKVIHKKMFEKLNLNTEFHNLNEYNLVMLPKFCNNFYRVAILKVLRLPKNANDVLSMYRHATIFMEYIRDCHYFNGTIIILDYLDINIVELAKVLNLADLRQFISLAVDCFGMRVKGINMLTSSNMFEVIVSILKQTLSTKLGQRISVHKSYESLSDFIPKDVLPVNYGGTEKSLADLNEMWLNVLGSKDNIEHMKKLQEFGSDESRRQLDDFNNQYMGTPGSFRRFVVD